MITDSLGFMARKAIDEDHDELLTEMKKLVNPRIKEVITQMIAIIGRNELKNPEDIESAILPNGRVLIAKDADVDGSSEEGKSYREVGDHYAERKEVRNLNF